MATRRVTMREAANVLGVSKEAVRKRIVRSTLRPDVDVGDGRSYVYLDADTGTDEAPTRRQPGYNRVSDKPPVAAGNPTGSTA